MMVWKVLAFFVGLTVCLVGTVLRSFTLMAVGAGVATLAVLVPA